MDADGSRRSRVGKLLDCWKEDSGSVLEMEMVGDLFRVCCGLF